MGWTEQLVQVFHVGSNTGRALLVPCALRALQLHLVHHVENGVDVPLLDVI